MSDPTNELELRCVALIANWRVEAEWRRTRAPEKSSDFIEAIAQMQEQCATELEKALSVTDLTKTILPSDMMEEDESPSETEKSSWDRCQCPYCQCVATPFVGAICDSCLSGAHQG